MKTRPMLNKWLSFLVIGLAMLSLAGQAGCRGPEVKQQVDATLAGLSSTDAPGIAVLVIKRGENVYERGFGVTDLRSLTLPVLSVGTKLRRQQLPAWAVATGVAALFVGIVGFARAQGYWNSEVPSSVYQQLMPHANEERRPMPRDPGMNE